MTKPKSENGGNRGSRIASTKGGTWEVEEEVGVPETRERSRQEHPPSGTHRPAALPRPVCRSLRDPRLAVG